MNVLFINAHQQPTSPGGQLHHAAIRFFEKHQHKATIVDLYNMGFDAMPRDWDFKTKFSASSAYSDEQAAAAKHDSFGEEIKSQIDALRKADLVLIEFPLQFHNTPAILKGWLDKVMAVGVAYDENHRYAQGLLKGKQCLVVTTTDEPQGNYSASGVHKASVSQHLYWLLHGTLAMSGMDVLKPTILHRASLLSDGEVQEKIDAFQQALASALDSPSFVYKNS